MTQEERLNLAFEMIELSIAISPNKQLHAPVDDSIEWIELKFRNDHKRSS